MVLGYNLLDKKFIPQIYEKTKKNIFDDMSWMLKGWFLYNTRFKFLLKAVFHSPTNLFSDGTK